MLRQDPVRSPLVGSLLGRVEHVHYEDRSRAVVEGFSAEFQLCLPTGGLFVWHVGAEEVVGDSNHVLFVRAEEPYRLTQPLGGGYTELICTPDVALLAEVAETGADRLARHPLFTVRSRRVGSHTQRLGASLLWRHRRGHRDVLADEETMVSFVRAACLGSSESARPGRATSRLLRRTKEHLAAHFTTALRLTDVAAAVGASPSYLTSVFRRFEGVPLHQYVRQLRLSESLVRLPDAADLTTLAVDLGFSSHSHFAASFRKAFGLTPSAFRDGGR